MVAVELALPESLRPELKEPLGTLYTDVDALLATVDGPLIAIGDIVTVHVQDAGRIPDLAVYDERSEREPVDDAVAAKIPEPDASVTNPAGTITEALLRAIRDGIDSAESVGIKVDGEEDLATLPAIIAAPNGASVVYGQPGEGMVHVRVTDDSRDHARAILSRMDGDVERALEILLG